MNSKLMIRLIDVALNILLCFIAISRLRTEYVDLPSTGKSQLQAAVPHEAKVQVYGDKFRFHDNGRDWNCRSLAELETVLVQQNDRYATRGLRMIVTIESHKTSIMQNLVDVLDICQRNQIEKNLNYENFN